MRCLIPLLLFLAIGCAEKRTVTITAHPSDAVIRIDDQDKGRGSLKQEIIFKNDRDTHKISASRLGFKDRTMVLGKDDKIKTVDLDLHAQTKLINIIVQPVGAIININGQAISNEPIGAISKELAFTVDASGKWTSYNI